MSLKSKIASTEEEINNIKKQKEQLYDKIENLQKASKCISDLKDELKSLKSNSLYFDQWQGEKADKYNLLLDDYLKEKKLYYKNIDEIHDAINDETTKLENKIYSYDIYLGDLKSALNSLKNELANLFN